MGAPIIVAIDQGYGWHKALATIGGEEVYREAFPSIAIPPPPDAGQYGGGLPNLRVQTVEVDSRRFLCGHDVMQFADALNNDRQRTPDYALQDSYYGMFLYTLGDIRRATGRSEYDVVMAGLPLSAMHLKEALRARLEGKHRVPTPLGERGDTIVTVRRVEIIPQPGGALHAAAAVYPQLVGQKNLILDFGYFTFDFLFANGKMPYPPRSGAVPGGFSGFLDAVNDRVADDMAAAHPERLDRFFMPHHNYEEALRNGGKLATRSGVIDLAPATERAMERIDHYIDVMLSSKLQSTRDVINVVFAGGGAAYLRPCFERRFPDMTNLYDMPDPQFAIADGYMIVGKTLVAGTTR